MASLFDPFPLKDITLRHRIAVSPMCQYSAVDGVITDWHYAHLAALARGVAGLVVAAAPPVSPPGRITPGSAGRWTHARESVASDTSVSVRVDLGGGRILKKKNRR